MKVSVIIPVYNVESYVQECLDSVLGQTYRDIEVICINDAGTDGSWNIVKESASRDNRIKLYENDTNHGLSYTRNRGLDLAEGEYVYFLDSDDLILPDTFEKLIERGDAGQLDAQVFESSFIYDTAELKEKFHTNRGTFKGKYPEVMSGKDLFIAWMNVWDWIPVQGRFFYNRDFLLKNHLRYTEGMIHEDEIFAFDVLMRAERVHVWNDAFFIRRFRESSIMTGVTTMKSVEGCAKILEHVSSLDGMYMGDVLLNRAVKFYMYKIFCDAVKKYKAAAALEPQSDNGDRGTAFDLIEALGLWEDKT